MFDMQQLWDVELSIVEEIDRICRKNGLKYSLAYGTLLGAVRHGGFIPWDDDIDLMMPRKDYDRLKEIWDNEANSRFILQDKSRESLFNQNFIKIRKDNTAYVQNENELKRPFHTGIFVDIFPAERKAPGKLRRKIQVAACMVDLLYSREHTSGGKSEVFEKMLLLLPRSIRLKLLKKIEKFIQKWKDANNEPFFCPNTYTGIFRLYPFDLFNNLSTISFCGREFMCVNNAHDVLTNIYGNYMELPPESERTLTHHPLFVDFNSTY